MGRLINASVLVAVERGGLDLDRAFGVQMQIIPSSIEVFDHAFRFSLLGVVPWRRWRMPSASGSRV